MMKQKVNMHMMNDNNEYVQVLPQTVSEQVLLGDGGVTLNDFLNSTNPIALTVTRTPYTITAASDKQSLFSFDEPTQNVTPNNVTVHLNGEFLHINEEYSVNTSGNKSQILLTSPVTAGSKLHVTVDKYELKFNLQK